MTTAAPTQRRPLDSGEAGGCNRRQSGNRGFGLSGRAGRLAQLLLEHAPTMRIMSRLRPASSGGRGGKGESRQFSDGWAAL